MERIRRCKRERELHAFIYALTEGEGKGEGENGSLKCLLLFVVHYLNICLTSLFTLTSSTVQMTGHSLHLPSQRKLSPHREWRRVKKGFHPKTIFPIFALGQKEAHSSPSLSLSLPLSLSPDYLHHESFPKDKEKLRYNDRRIVLFFS